MGSISYLGNYPRECENIPYDPEDFPKKMSKHDALAFYWRVYQYYVVFGVNSFFSDGSGQISGGIQITISGPKKEEDLVCPGVRWPETHISTTAPAIGDYLNWMFGVGDYIKNNINPLWVFEISSDVFEGLISSKQYPPPTDPPYTRAEESVIINIGEISQEFTYYNYKALGIYGMDLVYFKPIKFYSYGGFYNVDTGYRIN